MDKFSLISDYYDLLVQMQETLNLRHYEKWVKGLAGRREELNTIDNGTMFAIHAKRTARALGAMGSIGDIALADGDPDFLKLVDDLYQKCKQIISEYGVQ